jgi:hypothetical protein
VRSFKYNGRVQGVPSLEQNPTTKAYPLISNLSRQLDELEGQLLHAFAELAHYAVSRTDLAPSGANRSVNEQPVVVASHLKVARPEVGRLRGAQGRERSGGSRRCLLERACAGSTDYGDTPRTELTGPDLVLISFSISLDRENFVIYEDNVREL